MARKLGVALQVACPWPDVQAMEWWRDMRLPRLGLAYFELCSLHLGLRHTPNLRELDLSGNFLGPGWAQALAEAVKHTPTLASIGLSSCGLQHLSSLKAVLEHIPDLKALHLGGNALGPDGVRGLASGVRETQGLTKLTVESNCLGPEGAREVAQALRWSWQLAELRMGNNVLGPQGVGELAAGLRHVHRLTELHVEGNYIEAAGARALAAPMRHLLEIETLDVSYNALGMDGIRALAVSLQFTRSLRRAILVGNGLDPGAERELAHGFRQLASGLLSGHAIPT